MTTRKTDERMDAPAGFTDMNRREFLTSTVAAVGGAMVLGFWLPPRQAAAMHTAPAQPWYRDALVPEINAWITIAPDDTVTIRVGQTEMGTGVFTNCPMMVAEELQCDWSKVRAEYASANRNIREMAPEWTLKVPGNGASDPAGGGNPTMLEGANGVYRRLATNSSGSVREGRYYLQLAGAEARERLLLAAAATWTVPVSELVAKDSVITHAKSKRRTTYGALAATAAKIQLPDPSTIKLKTPDKFWLMGTEQKDRTVPLKVTGQATFASDLRLPGMLYAAAKACPVWGGQVKSYDFNAIRNRPGVHSVVPFGGPDRTDQRLGHVSGGIAVVADSWWRAQTALDAMPIEWDYGPSVSVSSASLLDNHIALMKQPGKVHIDVGNVDRALGGAAKVIEATYTVPYVSQARMEPGTATAIVTADRVDIWTGDQMPEDALRQAAEEADIAPEKVYVHLTFIGGGYGHGGNAGANQQAVAVAKTLNGRPVKLIWKREEDWGYGLRPRPMGAAVFRATLDANGWPIAIDAHSSGQEYGGDQQYRGLTAFPYFIPNYRYTQHIAKSHVPCVPRRATGSSTNAFYLESFIDELAHAAGKDPYQYRRELIARNPPAPTEGIGGFSLRDEWLLGLDMAAKMSEWGSPLPAGWARGIAIDDRRRPTRVAKTVCAEVHTVEVTRRGQVKLHRVDLAFDQGFTLVNPLAVRKQIEGQMAWGFDDTVYQGVTVKDGRAVETNIDTLATSRMAEYPKQVKIAFFKSNHWNYGAGEEAIPQVAPAIANAVFKITGKRIRSLPLKDHDLSWGA
jgi:isoquinoline 1-oxidoreductase beta subunit